MADAEKTITNSILVLASQIGARLFRQNVGVAWIGTTILTASRPRQVELRPGDVLIRNARRFHAGLCKGSSDIVGWSPYVVQPDDVGRTLAIFTAAEVKTGKLAATDEQAKFVRAVRAAGGRSVVARSEEDAAALLKTRPG